MQTTANHPPKGPFFRAINVLIVALLVCLVGWVLYKFDFLRSIHSTDNAQIRRHLVPVNSRAQGYIRQINFQEFSHVNKGDLLVAIDDSEYALRLAQAEASRAMAVANRDAVQTSITSTRNNLLVSDSGIAEIKVRLDNATKDLERYTSLLTQNVVTPSQYDRAKTEADALQAKYDMLVRQRHTTELALDEQVKHLAELEASIQLSDAAVSLAKLNLSYTQIAAPCSGCVGRKEIQPGQLIQPGQTVVEIVDDSQVWIMANFKERRAAHLAPGDAVSIEVDGLPGQTYEGRIGTVSPATGSAYSLVPTDNSAGNFVKVEQLIPIRVEFTDKNTPEALARLRNGESATVTVHPSR